MYTKYVHFCPFAVETIFAHNLRQKYFYVFLRIGRFPTFFIFFPLCVIQIGGVPCPPRGRRGVALNNLAPSRGVRRHFLPNHWAITRKICPTHGASQFLCWNIGDIPTLPRGGMVHPRFEPHIMEKNEKCRKSSNSQENVKTFLT